MSEKRVLGPVCSFGLWSDCVQQVTFCVTEVSGVNLSAASHQKGCLADERTWWNDVISLQPMNSRLNYDLTQPACSELIEWLTAGTCDLLSAVHTDREGHSKGHLTGDARQHFCLETDTPDGFTFNLCKMWTCVTLWGIAICLKAKLESPMCKK